MKLLAVFTSATEIEAAQLAQIIADRKLELLVSEIRDLPNVSYIPRFCKLRAEAPSEVKMYFTPYGQEHTLRKKNPFGSRLDVFGESESRLLVFATIGRHYWIDKTILEVIP